MKLRLLGPIAAKIICAAGSLFTASPAKAQCDTNPYLGSVCMTGIGYCPRFYPEAAGQLLSINQFSALFSLFGTTYGGNGRTNFQLPDFRAFGPVGLGSGPGISEPVFPGEMRGYENIYLSRVEMPAHTHTATFTPETGKSTMITMGTPGNLKVDTTVSASTANGADTTPSMTNNVVSTITGPAARLYGPGGGSNVALSGVTSSVSGNPDIPARSGVILDALDGGTVTLGSTGNQAPITNIPPQTAIRYCVAIEGTYPPRPS